MRGRDLAVILGSVGAGLWLANRVRRQATAYDFMGKSVLITGGSRGLGLVLARHLVDEGARVAICARDAEELQRAQDDLAQRGGSALIQVCDIADQNQVETMVREVAREQGAVDVLINNAGTIAMAPLEEMTLDDFRAAMDTNFWGALYTIMAVLPGMRERRAGRIVNISSIGGKVAVPHLLPYCASKFALAGLSEGLRMEAAKDGIVVTTVIPGLMRTGSPRNAVFKGQHRAEYAWFSILDSLSATSTSADSAARSIVNACRHGDAEVVLTLPAKAAVLVHNLFPGLTQDLSALVNQLVLPGPGGVGQQAVKGKDSESEWSPSWLTESTERAARQNNQMKPEELAGRGAEAH
jgi:NAD(P)-dependent dehydrogenase (short-subunit alcohol dehydrogenase family)